VYTLSTNFEGPNALTGGSEEDETKRIVMEYLKKLCPRGNNKLSYYHISCS
jgi:hypothetical protein